MRLASNSSAEIEHFPVLFHIEDDNTCAFLLKKKIEATKLRNCKVYRANDGEDAIAQLSQDTEHDESYVKPDLILLDVGLPKLDGFEVLSFIRDNKKFDDTPTIVVSASNNEDDISEAYERGANCYVFKGENFDTLGKAIDGLTNFWLDPSITNEPQVIGDLEEVRESSSVYGAEKQQEPLSNFATYENLCIEVTHGPHVGKCFYFDKRYISIGRDFGNDLILDGDNSVSRRHALLKWDGGVCSLSDSGSSNGTYLQVVSQMYPIYETEVELLPGDTIHLGATTISVSWLVPNERSL
jgi:DNA-binding response OmpR family regulator